MFMTMRAIFVLVFAAVPAYAQDHLLPRFNQAVVGTGTVVFTPGALDRPDKVNISDINDTEATVSWRDLSSGEQSFGVYVRENIPGPGGSWRSGGGRAGSQPAGETGEVMSHRVTGLRSGRTYCFVVAPTLGASVALSGNDQVCAAMTGDRETLEPPVPPTLALLIPSTNKIRVQSIDRSDNEAGFAFERRGPGSNWQRLKTLIYAGSGDQSSSMNLLEFVDHHPLMDRSNCYRVGAYNADHMRHSSVECMVTYPRTVNDLEVTQRRFDSLTVGWTDSAQNEDGYRLSWCLADEEGHQIDDTCVEGGPVGPFDGTGTADATGLMPSTDYAINLYVFNAAGELPTMRIVGRTRPAPPGQGPGADLPNLAFFGSITITPVFPDPGEAFEVSWITCNYGETATGAGWTDSLRLSERFGNHEEIHMIDAEALGSGECAARSFQHSGLPEGDYVWDIIIDADNEINELTPLDNSNSYGFII